MENRTYSLPSELTQEAKLFRFLTIRTLVTVSLFVIIGLRISPQIYGALQIPFVIFNGFVGFYISVISKNNKQKRYYQSFFILLFRDKRYYKPIPPQDKLPDTIKKYNEYERRLIFLEPEND